MEIAKRDWPQPLAQSYKLRTIAYIIVQDRNIL
jgi:hypothetical protein